MRKKEQTTVEPLEGKIVSEKTLGIETAEVIEAEVVNDEVEGDNHPNFIESNTQAITLDELTNNNIIPTFCDNSLTISHQSFIGAVTQTAEKVFGELTPVECRVSHPIIGRVPSAQHKKASELTEDEKTTFYQRLAFVCHIKNLTRSVNGQTVHLCVGGCRAYNEDKLYYRQSPLKFKIFVGWQVRVCSNLMLTCDGNSGTIECLTEADIMQKATELFESFNPNKEEALRLLENLQTTVISEQQFCNIIGRLRLWQSLPLAEQKQIPTRPSEGCVKGISVTPTSVRRTGRTLPHGTSCNWLQKLSSRHRTLTDISTDARMRRTFPSEYRKPSTVKTPRATAGSSTDER